MAKVPRGRRVERAAVNTVRALFERHDHIVQEIDGQNDFGEDLFVTFTDDGLATNDVVKIQVKGGVSWRRANGYAVPVRQHYDTWSNGNVPVFCVVYDPETELLYWANATEQLRRARRDGTRRTVVGISANAVLDDRSVEVFAGEARRYAGRFRGELAILHQLSEMSGVDFDPDDQVLHFVNEYGAVLIFWWPCHDDTPYLLHSELDWEPHEVTPDLLADESVDGCVSLEFHELLWLAVCMKAGAIASEIENEDHDCELHEDPDDHANIEAETLHRHVAERMLERLEADPTLMTRSIRALRNADDLNVRLLEELGALEADLGLVAEAMAFSRETCDETSIDALTLVLFYLVERVRIGSPRLPLDEQINIDWRVPANDGGDSRA